MKQTVLSAKTLGTATKRFEVIVEVIKKIPPKKIFFFVYTVLFYFLGTCSVSAMRKPTISPKKKSCKTGRSKNR